MANNKITLTVKIVSCIFNLFYTFVALLFLCVTVVEMASNHHYPENLNVDGKFINVFSFLSPFGIYAVWWMIFNYDKKTFRQIPKFIWLSVGLGIIAFISFFLSDISQETTDPIKTVFAVIFFGGPFWLGITLLILMMRRDNKT